MMVKFFIRIINKSSFYFLLFFLFTSINQKLFPIKNNDSTELIIYTFLGNFERNYYGSNAPEKLNIIWKLYLGKGETVISRKAGPRTWAGAGWTGQPLLVKENDSLFLIQGAYDHNLKKINAINGKIRWEYKFDDVIKGTGTIWVNNSAENKDNSIVILQGSRLGVGNYLDSKHIPSYRAISYYTGQELWRLDVKWTDSYSRDVDGSALLLNDTAYLGLENSLFTIFDPNPTSANIKDNMLQPYIYKEIKLYTQADVTAHRHNVVTESSPAILKNRIYITSGSGHVFGYNLNTKKIDWEFYTGADMDGSPSVTSDNCLVFSIEKQFIPGKGGVMKINPDKSGENSVEWYFPTLNKNYFTWKGGVIGSVGITDSYKYNKETKLAAFIGIDGYLYVVNHTQTQKDSLVFGPNLKYQYKKPALVYKKYTGESISTPIFIDDKLIAATYNGIYLFIFNDKLEFTLIDTFEAEFEATPIVYNGHIYIASRNGFLYCFGN